MKRVGTFKRSRIKQLQLSTTKMFDTVTTFTKEASIYYCNI
jgi:hypothetical protein